MVQFAALLIVIWFVCAAINGISKALRDGSDEELIARLKHHDELYNNIELKPEEEMRMWEQAEYSRRNKE